MPRGPAPLVHFRSRADQLQAEQAERLRQLVLALPELPQRAVGEILATIDRQTAADQPDWTFVMMSPADNDRVVSHLLDTAARPQVAVRLWAKLFLHLRRDTGDIVRTREELAEEAGTTPQHISEIMSELEAFGAIVRFREKVAGMRGPGLVRYRMNSRIATHQTGAARVKAQAAAPLLGLIEGGRK
ncbi:helix-turn-helix domain-containing protein [Paracraurococcus ruber]|uniref:HTH crp-type domain-containing protein n=1 Tax=Paracraurococcus ruber TaxID=77675 RepID=A0ABS1D5R4_9PROT|nr:helix-turn-helix domain-containing protein [Paracraurococcus ruber]MBK1662154.1 hypothetical protein [Paracraurococcus ruber]TDG16183.1 helix-turn-helix domain-containing protein [Paracraurococcus ruber]